MKVKVNNKEMELDPSITLHQLAIQLELPDKGIAIAVNNKMISRSEWESFFVQANDAIIIIKAACGG
ncbi:sulfur carrier protein ThiS [Parabacteroides pacaensis]|uniref:sulfur carrier protein ThiS n=1 Tax=Parabacteroides pacaensis TaxID=2086575 RepID=UPI000D0F1BD8|nr:sulfur carrier protein ThiS [Parabacteroides pacaensis]